MTIQWESGDFTAIDFETADYGADSACAVGLVRVAGGRIAERRHHLIRPPRREFVFTYIHGISWEDVRQKPTFGELWPQIAEVLGAGELVAAHNASFDMGVLRACCRAAGIPPPDYRVVCTVRLARGVLKFRPANLPSVCGRLGIELNHHDALSDAEACAKIVLAARAAREKAVECR